MMARGLDLLRIYAAAWLPFCLLLGSAGCATTPVFRGASEPTGEPWVQEASRSPRDEEKAFAREGLYLGFQLGASDLFGDYDGDTALVDDPMTPTNFVFIPELDAGPVYGVSLAYRWKRHEIALLWEGSEHDGTFLGAPGFDTDFQYIDLVFKQYWWIDKPMQPYLFAGFGVSSARIDNGASDLVVTEDALLEDGVAFDFGGGIALYAGPWFSLFGQALWRFSSFESVNGIGPKLPIAGDIDSDNLELTVGANFRILRPHL